jgi:hypothetical protein
LFLLFVALATVGCLDGPTDLPFDADPQFAAQGVVHSATGSGHLPSGAEDKRVFAFTALEHADGSVSGQFTLVITAPVLGSENPAIGRIEAEVVCMSVSGNRAWVGGVVKSAARSDWVGRQTGWAVEDNGPGNSGDLISLMNIPSTNPDLAQSVCDAQTRVPNRLVEGGSVRVR